MRTANNSRVGFNVIALNGSDGVYHELVAHEAGEPAAMLFLELHRIGKPGNSR
jgi:hypothetical protein